MSLDAAVSTSTVIRFVFAFDDNYMAKSFHWDFIGLESVHVDHCSEASRVKFVCARISTIAWVGSWHRPRTFKSFRRYKRKSFHFWWICKKMAEKFLVKIFIFFIFLTQLTVVLEWRLENIATVRQVGHFRSLQKKFSLKKPMKMSLRNFHTEIRTHKNFFFSQFLSFRSEVPN